MEDDTPGKGLAGHYEWQTEVIQSSGKSAFERGSRLYRLQRDRLAGEGVAMSNGRVDMERFRWQPDLDELLWKPTATWDEE